MFIAGLASVQTMKPSRTYWRGCLRIQTLHIPSWITRSFLLLRRYLNAMQQSRVTGIVTDAGTGEPLIGVTIQVKGTMTGSITQADGSYSVDVPASPATLIFSFVGYATQEVEVAGRSVINLSLMEEATSPRRSNCDWLRHNEEKRPDRICCKSNDG